MTSEKRRAMEEDYRKYKLQFPNVKEISAPELRQLLSSGDKITLVDVRTPEERQVATISKDVLSPEQFEAQKNDLKDHTIITYCTAGLRSGKLASKIEQEGFNVKNLKGSIVAWTQEGYPLVKGDGSGEATHRVHAYGAHWGEQMGDGFEPVTFSSSGGLLKGVQSVLPRWLGGSG